MYLAYYTSDAASRWAGWTLAQPEIGSSVNPITTRGADYAHHITASPPRFENPVAALHAYTLKLLLYVPNIGQFWQYIVCTAELA